MFWGTADNTGSDSREPNNIDHCMLKDSQSGLGYLPACCLSPFSPLLEIGSSKERLGVNSSPCPSPVVSPFHLVKKVGGMADVFHFVLYQVTCWDRLLGFQSHWQNSFLPCSFFIWLVFKRMVMEGHSPFCLFIKTTPMCQSLLPPFANK